MTDVVADGLQWEPRINKALHAGMSECVRPGSTNGYTGLVQVMTCPPRYRSVCEGDVRRETPGEQEPVLGLRAAILQICNDCVAHQRRKRVDRDVISFALAHVQPFALLVHVVKSQIGDLTSP